MSDLELRAHRDRVSAARLADLCESQDRSERLRLSCGAVLADFSRQQIDEPALDALLRLAERSGLDAARRELRDGGLVNSTEGRAALHHGLRAGTSDHAEHSPGAAAVRLAEAVRGTFLAAVRRLRESGFPDGAPLRTVINVGIGGSDLGPRLLADSLARSDDSVDIAFVSGVDAHQAQRLMQRLDPRTTAVVLVSKSFGTEETLLNGRLLCGWLRQSLGDEAAGDRLFSVTAKPQLAAGFGVPEAHCFPIWDWVGGRYSVWSAVGFAATLVLGPSTFDRLLAGARAMDRHFFESPLTANLPVIRGLIEHWNRSWLGHRARCVVSYDPRLALLPSYLQQLEMESNGKSVKHSGEPISAPAHSVVFGGVGTDVQHAFFQALHQGHTVVPVEFVGVIRPDHPHALHHNALLANLLAQSAALAEGFSAEPSDPLAAHRHHPGNRPSTVYLLDALTPEALGGLLAMYEHSVFVEAHLAGINAFDQWGVELGKVMARRLLPAFSDADKLAKIDPVTRGLIAEIRARGG